MNDSADAIAATLKLSKIAQSGTIPANVDLQQGVDKYESAMMSRVFEWIKASSGFGSEVSGLMKVDTVFLLPC